MKKDLLLKASVQDYLQGQLSLARAAKICGLTRLEFIDVLNSLDIPIFQYTPKDIDEIHEESTKILERLN